MIVATTKAELKRSKNARPPIPLWAGERINRAILQFIPMCYTGGDAYDKDTHTRIELLPGEKIRSMVEWTCKIGENHYDYLLLGTCLANRDGRKTGRLLFLVAKKEIDGSVSVVLKNIKNVDSQVRALAAYDESKVVLSQDKSLSVYGFVFDSGRSARSPPN
jgi:hypothetical protein